MPITGAQHPGHRAELVRIIGMLLVIAIAAYLGTRSLGADAPSADPTESASQVIVGEPGGGVVLDSAASPPSPTPGPTQLPAPSPEAPPTEAPVATTAPTAAVPVVVATEAPAPMGVAIAGPVDVVATFYGAAVDGRFDDAYSHWSERMRGGYPRAENLDERFDNTSAIVFDQLHLAELAGSSATVQANFTEVYDTGESRQFIGFWRLVLVDGRWLLDEPHY